jgi:hypothetical protein
MLPARANVSSVKCIVNMSAGNNLQTSGRLNGAEYNRTVCLTVLYKTRWTVTIAEIKISVVQIVVDICRPSITIPSPSIAPLLHLTAIDICNSYRSVKGHMIQTII